MGRQYILGTIDVALCAGADILSIYNDPASDFQTEKKADNPPLMIADRKAYKTIAGHLKNTPYPLLSEEGKHLLYIEKSTWDVLWTVDPLDGTEEFIKRGRESTVNIALVHNSVPIMGVIYLPVKKEPYFVEETLGAYKLSSFTTCGGASLEELMAEAIRLPVEDKHSGSVIVASRSHLSPETESYTGKMRYCHPDVESVSSGSFTKICSVAEGKADVYPRFAPTMEWDTTAGYITTRVAGMEVCQAEKEEPLRYNEEDLLNPQFIVEPRCS